MEVPALAFLAVAIPLAVDLYNAVTTIMLVPILLFQASKDSEPGIEDVAKVLPVKPRLHA
jgi:hypothetical protein